MIEEERRFGMDLTTHFNNAIKTTDEGKDLNFDQILRLLEEHA